MEIPQLMGIAQELDIKVDPSLSQQDVIYAILDKAAEQSASGETTSKRKRTRIVKKDTDRVYSVNGKEGENYDVKSRGIKSAETPSLFSDMPVAPAPEPEQPAPAPEPEQPAPAPEQPEPAPEKPAPKQRGRKSKAELAAIAAEKEKQAKAAKAEQPAAPEEPAAEAEPAPGADIIPEADGLAESAGSETSPEMLEQLQEKLS